MKSVSFVIKSISAVERRVSVAFIVPGRGEFTNNIYYPVDDRGDAIDLSNEDQVISYLQMYALRNYGQEDLAGAQHLVGKKYIVNSPDVWSRVKALGRKLLS